MAMKQFDIPSFLDYSRMDLERRSLSLPPGTFSRIYADQVRQTGKTTDFTASDETVILANATGGDIRITLPAASGKTNKWYWIKKIDTTSHSVKVKGNVPDETIDNEVEFNITIPMTCLTIVCDGSNWWII